MPESAITITTATEIPKSEIATLKEQSHPIVTRANLLLITDSLSYTEAAEILTHEINPMKKAVLKGCDAVRTATKAAAKAALEQEKALLSPLKQAETLLKTKMEDYQLQVDQALTESVTAITIPVPKVAGISTRQKWTGNIVDPAALIQAVAEGTVPATVIQFDQTKLDQLINAMDGEKVFPGVENVKEIKISGRAMR